MNIKIKIPHFWNIKNKNISLSHKIMNKNWKQISITLADITLLAAAWISTTSKKNKTMRIIGNNMLLRICFSIRFWGIMKHWRHLSEKHAHTQHYSRTHSHFYVPLTHVFLFVRLFLVRFAEIFRFTTRTFRMVKIFKPGKSEKKDPFRRRH